MWKLITIPTLIFASSRYGMLQTPRNSITMDVALSRSGFAEGCVDLGPINVRAERLSC
jgi:hypothetical protein